STCLTYRILILNLAHVWILRYLKGTSHFGLLFDKNSVKGFVDSDAGDLDKRHSISGYVFHYVCHFTTSFVIFKLLFHLQLNQNNILIDD
ncbi:hypothetical protein ACJX0J_034525, partial [Zea mays]